MREHTIHFTSRLAVVLLTCGLASYPSAVQADGARLNRYQMPVLASDGVSVPGDGVLEVDQWSMRVMFDYANDPLLIELQRGALASESFPLVSHQVDGHLAFGWGVLDALTVFGALDVVGFMQGSDSPRLDVLGRDGEADGAGLSDLRLGGRYRLLDRATPARLSLSLQAAVIAPLATLADGDQRLRGESSFAGDVDVLLGADLRAVRFALQLGTRLRPNTSTISADIGTDLTYGLGAYVPVVSRVELLAEGRGATRVQNAFAERDSHFEVLGGVRAALLQGLSASVAAGPGMSGGFGTPDVRVVGGLSYVAAVVVDRDQDGILDEADRCPAEAEDVDGFEDGDGCPDHDNDADGVPDGSDACPGVAEDLDGYEDGDGCPEDDNDGDGVPDGSDACPAEAEDADGFEDTDGCPDPDNDADGVADDQDDCPIAAEDVDGFEDGDGCPDVDNDGDGIADGEDACPLVAGTADERGCSAKVQVDEAQIRIADRVEFATGKAELVSGSETVLDAVQQILKTAGHLSEVAVVGHTDNVGADDHNMALSGQRAQAVVDYLVSRGIDAARLRAFGCGELQPLGDSATEEGRRRNRRVEFHILKPAPDEPADLGACVAATPEAQ